MNMEMLNLKKNYLRRILDISLNNQNYSTIIFYASFSLDEIKPIIEELKDEYHIKNVIFMDFDYDKIKAFYDSNPSEKEMEMFIPKFLEPIGNVKCIYFQNTVTDFSDVYFSDYVIKYYRCLKESNKEVFNKMENLSGCDQTLTICPNREWAEGLFGSKEDLDNLWIKINRIFLNSSEEKREMENIINLMNELNRMNIRKLNFCTNLGTDFRISLNPHSIWCCTSYNYDGIFNFDNYPSYEIYTSPNCYSAEGKIVLSKKSRFYYDDMIENATFEFTRGRLINCKSNSKSFTAMLLNERNQMNRIGEIALVSQDSPLAQFNEFFDSVVLDENTGCHFALGNSIEECIGVDKKKIEEKGARYYRYNTSREHNDFVFGNDSVFVEAETKSKKKILLMENGKWKI